MESSLESSLEATATATENKILMPFIGKLGGRFCFDCVLLVAVVTKDVPASAVGAQQMFNRYYQQVDVMELEQPTPLALGGMLTCGAIKLKDLMRMSARVPCQGLILWPALRWRQSQASPPRFICVLALGVSQVVSPGEKCTMCKTADGELRACSFCPAV